MALADPLVDEPPEAVAAAGLPVWCDVAALLAIAVGSTIRFRGQPSHAWIALAGSVVALTSSRFGTYAMGEIVGPFLGAFALGVAANLYARTSRRPAELFTVPGLALLVPGSFGVRSMSALLSEETTVGVNTAFHMFLTAMALVTGLLFSSALVRSRTE